MTGFEGDGFEGRLLLGIYEGIVVNNVDPEELSRIKVRVPGYIETESGWALPRAGGAAQVGQNRVPPEGADVYVQFLGGRIEKPIWDWGPHGIGEAFPEHVAPDVSVLGDGPFRMIIDRREGEDTATWAVVLTNPSTGEEERVCSIQFDAENQSLDIDVAGAVRVRGQALVDIDSAGDVQIKGRKVGLSPKPIG